MSISKAHLHQLCLEQLQEKITRLKRAIQDAQQAASEDTKSSAGDKFETSRELMKQEINKYNQQLSQNSKLLEYLNQIDPTSQVKQVAFGSLVHTNEGLYYFSVPLGKISIEGKSCFALSLASPIGKALVGRQSGEVIEFMGREIAIDKVE